ncbi:hypothetical protein AGLY_004382, partial [Aphis glycines]
LLRSLLPRPYRYLVSNHGRHCDNIACDHVRLSNVEALLHQIQAIHLQTIRKRRDCVRKVILISTSSNAKRSRHTRIVRRTRTVHTPYTRALGHNNLNAALIGVLSIKIVPKQITTSHQLPRWIIFFSRINVKCIVDRCCSSYYCNNYRRCYCCCYILLINYLVQVTKLLYRLLLLVATKYTTLTSEGHSTFFKSFRLGKLSFLRCLSISCTCSCYVVKIIYLSNILYVNTYA